jgi:vacuolar-type H+-ATPase subunit D/Vma8
MSDYNENDLNAVVTGLRHDLQGFRELVTAEFRELRTEVASVKEDTAETKKQAKATNGRVNALEKAQAFAAGAMSQRRASSQLVMGVLMLIATLVAGATGSIILSLLGG